MGSKIGRWLLLVVLFSGACFANQAYVGYCSNGGTKVVTSGITSTTSVMASYPGCTVTVNNLGGGLATIFSDNLGTPLSNPFQASLITGQFVFYANNARYSITLSGGTPLAFPLPVTITDVLLNDPASPLGCLSIPALTGDVTSAGGTCATVLPNIAAAGTGLKTTINAKGQVTGVTTAASTDLSDTALIARLNAAANFGANPVTTGALVSTTGTFSGSISGTGATFTSEVAPSVTGVQLGDTAHRWDLFARNIDWSGTFTGGALTVSSLTVTPGASTLSSVTAKNIEAIRFADQFAIGSSTGGIQEAINDLPAGGGTVVIPPNYTAACTVGVTTGSKIIEFRGYGRTSVISGSGITILLLSSPGSAVRNLKITDPVGNAATIGIKLDNGLTGMTEWVIEDVFLQGTANLGTGIGTNFALIGKIRGGEIQSWNIGIQLTGPDNAHKSNAVEIDGTDIHVNVTGIDIPNTVDDVFIHSSTIEGNQLGISWGAGGNGGSMRLTSNHFENNLGGTPTNVQFNGAGCTVSGFGNTFGAGRIGGDYFSVGGAVNLNSYAETLNEGVHNDGTGVFIVNDPPFTPNFAGTGIVLFRQAGISQQVSPVGNNLFWILGWAWLQVDQIIKIKEAGAPGAGTAGFDWFWADSTAHRLKMNNNNGGAVTVAATSGDTFTSTTLTSPTINGTPTGTGIQTATLKKGTGVGNYTSASTTYVVVDATNLCYTVTIPTGWKLVAQASANIGSLTAVVNVAAALTDNAACATANAGILTEASVFGPSIGNGSQFSLSWVINGDGAAHNVALQFKTTNAADSVTLGNASATFIPTMTFLLTPSN